MNRSAKWMATELGHTLSTMMPSVMDERHEEIRSESISSDHLSDKPVIQQLAEDTDRSE